MPIYEFYCPKCNTIFNFFSRSINTTKSPACPRCKREGLDRQISKFAVVGRAVEKKEGEDLPVDDAKMERALSAMASEIEHVDEDDPRQAARLMRRLCDTTGMQLGQNMQEALQRMESGEDPESIEEDMGDLLEGEEPFKMDDQADGPRERLKTRRAPLRDETLYEM